MSTLQTYGNMLNQKAVAKKPLKEAPKTSIWGKMKSKPFPIFPEGQEDDNEVERPALLPILGDS